MFTYNDGGQTRSHNSGYCGVRALCIATGMSWKNAETHLREYTRRGKAGNGRLSSGIYKEDYDAALRALGWVWESAPKFAGRKARCHDMPRGTVIARQAGHYVAVVDGVPNDIWDCSEKMVYGYWKEKLHEA